MKAHLLDILPLSVSYKQGIKARARIRFNLVGIRIRMRIQSCQNSNREVSTTTHFTFLAEDSEVVSFLPVVRVNG